MSTNVARSYLQVKTKTSNQDSQNLWQTVSQIQNTNPSTSTAIKNKNDDEPIQPKHPHRKDLTMRLKNFLSPNAKIKAHRKANYLYRHSYDKIDTNLLIFLHGAGDNHIPYHNLAKKMNLPQCASLSLSASCVEEGFATLPFGLGHSWFDEMDYTTGQPLHKHNFKLVSSLKRAVEKLDRVLAELTGTLSTEGSAVWIPERIFLFGFSAGACLAMQTCLDRFEKGKLPLGGAICVAGGVNKKAMSSLKTTDQDRVDKETRSKEERSACSDQVTNTIASIEKTPVLTIGGTKDEQYTPDALNEASDFYNSFHVKQKKGQKDLTSPSAKAFIMKGKGHEMMNSEEETKAVMEFCAEHMVRRMIAMEGFCEISPDQFQK